MVGHWWLYGRKWPSPPLPKRKLGSLNTEGPQEIWNFQAPAYKIRKKFFAPAKKKNIHIFVGGGAESTGVSLEIEGGVRQRYNRAPFPEKTIKGHL